MKDINLDDENEQIYFCDIEAIVNEIDNSLIKEGSVHTSYTTLKKCLIWPYLKVVNPQQPPSIKYRCQKWTWGRESFHSWWDT